MTVTTIPAAPGWGVVTVDRVPGADPQAHLLPLVAWLVGADDDGTVTQVGAVIIDRHGHPQMVRGGRYAAMGEPAYESTLAAAVAEYRDSEAAALDEMVGVATADPEREGSTP